jgi:type II secretory pathway component PulF
MKHLLGLVVSNAVFLVLLQAFYVKVARRRWRIYMLVEHLATLVRSGMPVHSGLAVVGRDLGGFLGSRLRRVADAVAQGRTLAEAFESAPSAFPPLLRSMLSLGERSGNLAGFLEEMRRSYKRIAELPQQSLFIFFYPLLLCVGINVALLGIYYSLAPKFATIMTQIGTRIPGYMTNWSRIILANEAVLVLCVAMFAFFMMGGSSIHFRTSVLGPLKGVVDRTLLLLPLFGRMARDGAVHQFALCSGLYLKTGATLVESVQAAAEAVTNGPLRRRLERVARMVAEGSRLSAAARAEGIGGSDFLWFLETGEASGLLSEHLQLAATHYETKVRLAARVGARTVVPSFVLLNGAIVCAAFLLIFLPIQECLRATIKS